MWRGDQYSLSRVGADAISAPLGKVAGTGREAAGRWGARDSPRRSQERILPPCNATLELAPALPIFAAVESFVQTNRKAGIGNCGAVARPIGVRTGGPVEALYSRRVIGVIRPRPRGKFWFHF